MKVMITAGGTTEKIDNVRTIANISTGRLGSLTADAFAELPEVDEIFYLCGKTAILPQSNKTEIIHVGSVSELETAVASVFDRTDIDIIIHSMAVSDYRVKSVTSALKMAEIFLAKSEKLRNLDTANVEHYIEALLNESESIINGDGKISSNIENLLLVMEKTPKVISMFKKLSPQ